MKRSPSAVAALAVLLAHSSQAAFAQCADEVVHELLDGGQGYPDPPRLETPFGAAVVDGPFAFRVTRGAPNELGAIFYGVGLDSVFVPSFDAVVHPAAPFFFDFFGTDDDGRSPLKFATPTIDPSFCGDEVVFQAWVTDAGAPGGFTLTNGVRVRVGIVSQPVFVDRTDETDATTTGEVSELADLDGDGTPDLVLAYQRFLQIRLGVGARFEAPSPSADAQVDGDIHGLAVLDLNGDGPLDVAVATDDPDRVVVLLGDGAGGFLGSAAFVIGAPGTGLAGGDLNGDGLLDLVASTEGGAVSMLRGLGGGFLATFQTVPLGGGQSAVELADLDLDGALDIVAARLAGLVTVRTGNGNATFDPAQNFAAGSQPSALAVADLDQDGLLDVAVTNLASDDVSLLRGLGDGTLAPLGTLQAGAEPTAVRAVDLDGDLLLDLAIANRVSDDVGVHLAEGAGAFGPERFWGTGSFPSGILATDLDGDGATDLVVPGLGDRGRGPRACRTRAGPRSTRGTRCMSRCASFEGCLA